MALDPQGMLLLLALSESGGVRRAATKLGIPRSTVSRRLAQIENDAGAPLVVRSSRRFALTDLGRALAERATRLEALMRESEDVLRRSKAEPSGTLIVSAPPVLGEDVLPEIIAELAKRHARLTIETRISTDYVNLRRGDADIALRAAGLEDATDVYAARLGTSTTGCYASRAYLRANGTPQTTNDLSAHTCILISGRTTWRMKDELVTVSGRVRVDNFRIARELAARGVGIVWLARTFAKPLVDQKTLVPILERYWSKTPIFAVHASGSPPPAKIRAFIDLAKVAVARVLG